MAFNSPMFMFLFLPASFLLYFAVPRRAKNLALAAASLFFYAWGDRFSVFVLICSILVNYGFGRILGKPVVSPADTNREMKPRKAYLAVAIVFNLALLFYYKYLKFLVSNLDAMKVLDSSSIDFTGWHLPLGISFFTFGAISYLIDIYRQRATAERNLIDLCLYVALFPKIMAGPIVRYADIAGGIKDRKVTLEGFSYGVRRFVIGLGKKVLVANTVAAAADEVFRSQAVLDMPTAWLGILCYTIQIYFDFSGYSDMAIGLGCMFGFTFMENFNYPYISQSIQEFWRRWHISLSTWFRDYLYIPLGGSRGSNARTYFNLVVVFLLCGFWHGASWNFIIWGAYYGFFLAAERLGAVRRGGGVGERGKARGAGGAGGETKRDNGAAKWEGRRAKGLRACARMLRHVYVMGVVMIGWVFFRADDLPHALRYVQAMLSFDFSRFEYFYMTFYSRELILMLVIGIIGSVPVREAVNMLRGRLVEYRAKRLLAFFDLNCTVAYTAYVILLFFASLLQMANSTYNPFIYQKF